MKGLWAVSLPMILCRTLCVHIWLCTPGPCLSRASVPLEPVFDSECLCMFEAYVCVSPDLPGYVCLVCAVCVCECLWYAQSCLYMCVHELCVSLCASVCLCLVLPCSSKPTCMHVCMCVCGSVCQGMPVIVCVCAHTSIK